MFSASESRKKFNSTASEVQIEEYRSEYLSTKEYQKLEGKLKKNLTRDKLGINWGVINMAIFLNGLFMM